MLTEGAENEMLVLPPPRIIGSFGIPSKFVLPTLNICGKFGAFFQSVTIFPSNQSSRTMFIFFISFWVVSFPTKTAIAVMVER